MFLILGRFPITALEVVLLLLLMDFVLISIATDVQPAGHSPATWNLAQLTRVGLSIGLPGAAQMLALILVAEDLYDQTVAESQTTAWLAMFMWGMLALFSAREKSFFWSSRPSTVSVQHTQHTQSQRNHVHRNGWLIRCCLLCSSLFVSCSMSTLLVVEMVGVWLVCSFGVPGLEKIGFAMSSAVVALGLGCFVLNDLIKVAYIRLFDPTYTNSKTPEELARDARMEKEEERNKELVANGTGHPAEPPTAIV
jgi:hypothetical protein